MPQSNTCSTSAEQEGEPAISNGAIYFGEENKDIVELSFENAIMKAEDDAEMYRLIMALRFYQQHYTGYLEGLENDTSISGQVL